MDGIHLLLVLVTFGDYQRVDSRDLYCSSVNRMIYFSLELVSDDGTGRGRIC